MNTKKPTFAITWFLALSLLASNLIAQETSVSVDQEIERLIKPLFDSNFNMKKADAALSEIRQTPGITNGLLSKLDAELAKPVPEGYRSIALIRALAERTDYTLQQMQSIREKTKWAFSALKTGENNSHFFAEGYVRILGNNPSRENEDVLIAALSPALDSTDGVQERAVYALQKSGTSRAVAALNNLAKRIEPKPGHKNRLYDLVIETAPMLTTRTESFTSARLPPSVVQPAQKAPESKPTAPTPSEEPTSSTPWSIIVVLIVAGCGLLWLLLRRRS